MDAPVAIRGNLILTFTDSADGSVREIKTKNKVVTNGLGWIMGRCLGTNPLTLNVLAIGSGNKPVADNDGWLQAQTGAMLITPQISSQYINCSATFDEGVSTGTVQELGLFLSNGSLFARTVVTAQNKTATTSLKVAWSVSFEAI